MVSMLEGLGPAIRPGARTRCPPWMVPCQSLVGRNPRFAPTSGDRFDPTILPTARHGISWWARTWEQSVGSPMQIACQQRAKLAQCPRNYFRPGRIILVTFGADGAIVMVFIATVVRVFRSHCPYGTSDIRPQGGESPATNPMGRGKKVSQNGKVKDCCRAWPGNDRCRNSGGIGPDLWPMVNRRRDGIGRDVGLVPAKRVPPVNGGCGGLLEGR